MVLIYLIRSPSTRGLPARQVERVDGALSPRQRDAFVKIKLGEPRAHVRQHRDAWMAVMRSMLSTSSMRAVSVYAITASMVRHGGDLGPLRPRPGASSL